jgi:hypothetical protein
MTELDLPAVPLHELTRERYRRAVPS